MQDRFALLIIDLYSLPDPLDEVVFFTEFEATRGTTALEAVHNPNITYDVITGPTLDNCYAQAFHDGWSATDTVTTWHDREEPNAQSAHA